MRQKGPDGRLTWAASRAALLGALLMMGCEPVPRPPAHAEEVHQVAAGSNRFALDLYRQLSKAPGNLVFSPYGIHRSLAMASTGAVGRTHQELRTVLHAELPEAQFLHALSTLDEQLTVHSRGPNSPSAFRSISGMWVDQGFPILGAFSKTLQIEFRVHPEALDLNQRQQALQRINGWAAEATKGCMPQILDQLPGSTRMVLANAVHFMGTWASHFPPHATRPGAFIRLDGSRYETALMHQTSQLDFTVVENCKALAMDFRNGPFRMVFMLPERHGFATFENGLTLERLARILEGLKASHNGQLVKVTLPRFKFDLPIPVQDSVKTLGLQSAFLDSAEFSRLSPRPLRLDQVAHRALVDVDEEGAVAFSATSVIVRGVGMDLLEKQKLVHFRADHPFLFMIQDRSSGAILFMGRVLSP